jgi:anti-anti-sigma regulatory factor
MPEFSNQPVVSFTQIRRFLVVSLTDRIPRDMIESVMKTVLERAAVDVRGVLLNYAMVDIMDSTAFNAFRDITAALDVMGIPSVWVGMQPGVVCSLLDLGVDFEYSPICSACTLDDGISLLERSGG